MAIRINSSAQILVSNMTPGSIVNPVNGITVMCWLRKVVWNETGTRSLIGVYEVSASGAIQLGVNQLLGNLSFWNWGGTTLVNYPLTSLVSNQWYHFCYVYNQVNSLLYVNGELVNTTTVIPQNVGLNRVQVNSFPATPPLSISGTELSGDFEVDDYRMYSRPLSQDEIRTIYNLRGKDAVVYSLVLHYMFDDLSINSPVSSVFDTTPLRIELFNYSAAPVFSEKLIYNVR